MRCLCKKGQNGDPAWKKSCSWSFQDAPWSYSDVDNVQCKPSDFQPPSPWTRIDRNDIQFENEIVYPNYELSIDLKLDENPNSSWTNILGFYQTHNPIWAAGKYALGGRIPAVFLLPGKNELHICSAIGNEGNDCWNSNKVYKVGEEFNLKIKECLKIISKNKDLRLGQSRSISFEPITLK